MKAILRYFDSADNQRRIMCDTSTAIKLCDINNRYEYTTGQIYITPENILFIVEDKDVFLPDLVGGKLSALLTGRLKHFQDGQEAAKDYVAKNNPNTYMKFFDDTEGV